MATMQSLVEILSDGAFHSGEALGKRLGISRAAVWKHVRQLGQSGLDVHAVSGKGYRLAHHISLLQQQAINAALSDNSKQAIDSITILARTESTNAILAGSDSAADDRMQVCLAEYQTAGKGRRGRHWLAPYAGSINMSVAWNFAQGSAHLRGYSLAAGVCVARALRDCGVDDVRLKWPNDIFWGNKKLGGILIEIAGEADGNCRVITGIGINVNLSQQYRDAIDQPSAGLADILETAVDRNIVVARILEQLLQLHADFPARGLAPYLPDWDKLDACRDRQVDIQLGNETVSGVAAGINDEGQFLLLTGEGVRKYDAGDVSLRMSTGSGI